MEDSEMDTHAVSINYDKIMSGIVKQENELLENIEHIRQGRNLDDNSRIDLSDGQEIVNTSGYEPISLGHYITVQSNTTSTESADKSLLNKWADDDMNDKPQSLTENATEKAIGDNFCIADDILTIFPFVCGICNEKFKSLSVYFKHISVHEKMNTFLHCCDKSAASVEGTVTLFSCGLCSMKFPTLCTLHEHLIESEFTDDFVFKRSENTVYAYHENVSEHKWLADNVAHTYGTRKRTESHSNDNTYVDSVKTETSVKLSEENLDNNCLHDDSGNQSDTTIITEYKHVFNIGRKSKSKRYKKDIEKSKKKGRSKALAVNNVTPTGRKRVKRKDISRIKKDYTDTDMSSNIVGDISDVNDVKADNDDVIAAATTAAAAADDEHDKTTCKKDNIKQEVTKGSKKKGDQMFPCEICGTFVKRQCIRRHMISHKERTMSCDQCENLYNCKFQLRTHIKQVHTDEKKFTCDECGKSFKAWPYLKQHRQVHIKERNILCPACPMRFKYAALLRVHMRTHSDMKPFACEQCGKKFKRGDSLTTHKKYHTEDKPYSCPECHKTFKVKRDMKKHFRVHLPPKFSCSVCGKSFVQKYNMRVHMKIHGNVS
ncbi:zinc finger protein 85-like isoform X3 [Ruditapes philippinarum]|uniref:zinc finger protein 85-like isoform X3 n=1 Tax=Ruditapes philippinarum TaxID=129788 RepID=UPI00295C343C|nr:zinc finger protein 85-like isoform X3 [Ruditapes philippinarum]